MTTSKSNNAQNQDAVTKDVKKDTKKHPSKRKTKRSSAPEPAVMTRFFSRDESWLRFNERVLEEAVDTTNPLLERVKFLAITASNLDEFIEIRVAGMMQRIEDGDR